MIQKIVLNNKSLDILDLSDYASKNVLSDYVTRTDADNYYMPKGTLYVLNKGNSSNDSIQLTIPGHANYGYDRIQIWAWGNLNGSPFYGVIITASSGDGTNPSASCTGTHNFTCTYENSGSDRVITISGIPHWSQISFISVWYIK